MKKSPSKTRIFYHGTSCQNHPSISRDGLYPTKGNQIWTETTLQRGKGVYITKKLNNARAYACEATKTKKSEYTGDSIDLLSIYPNPLDVCVYEIRLPTDFPIEKDDITEDFRTINKEIPPKYLKILKPNKIANKLGVPLNDICKDEAEEVEYNIQKYGEN